MDQRAILSDILDASSPYAADTKSRTIIEFAAGTYELDFEFDLVQEFQTNFNGVVRLPCKVALA